MKSLTILQCLNLKRIYDDLIATLTQEEVDRVAKA